MGTILDPGKVIFGHFIDFGHFPIEIPIEAENFFGEGLPIELEQKQKLFWNPYGKSNGIRKGTHWILKVGIFSTP